MKEQTPITAEDHIWLKTYKGWRRLTEHIDEDCTLCNNERYSIDCNIKGDTKLFTYPACNWDDLGRTGRKCDIGMPLHLFVEWQKIELKQK